jgi:hypothetical protein
MVVASQSRGIVGNRGAIREAFTRPAVGRAQCPHRTDNRAYSDEPEDGWKKVVVGRCVIEFVQPFLLFVIRAHDNRPRSRSPEKRRAPISRDQAKLSIWECSHRYKELVKSRPGPGRCQKHSGKTKAGKLLHADLGDPISNARLRNDDTWITGILLYFLTNLTDIYPQVLRICHVGRAPYGG